MQAVFHFYLRGVAFQLALAVFAMVIVGSRPVSAVEFDAAALGKLRERMQPFVDKQEVSGMVAVVGTKNGIASIEAIGLRDAENKQPMANDTLFRIASMTKPITAIGIMILMDEGKLSVGDAVEKHLPEFRGQMIVSSRENGTVTLKKPSRPITVRDLLTHTSGLPGSYPEGLADLYKKRDRTLAESVLVSSQRALDFEPGSKCSYCNAGIDTLGRIIEVVSGQSFADFLQQRIFNPLEMKNTTFFPTTADVLRMAVMYDSKMGALVSTGDAIVGVPASAKHPIPAGGLCSTGPDIAKLYQMVLNDGELNGKRIISAASLQAMTKNQTGDLAAGFVPGMSFGFGWAVVKQPQGVTEMLSPGTFGHGGAFGTQGWIDPQKGIFMILMIQRVGMKNADGSDVRKELQATAMGAIKK